MGHLKGAGTQGFTLIEIVLGVLAIAIAISAILGAYLGQMTLNEHARNMTLAVHDATRVIEGIRRKNAGPTCDPPSVRPPVNPGTGQPYGTWDAWLTAQDGGQGKSILKEDATGAQTVSVTCQNRDGNTYCNENQMGDDEWGAQQPNVGGPEFDPIRITVAVCWRDRNRTIGECDWNGVALSADETKPASPDTADVIDSPAMLTTLLTCR